MIHPVLETITMGIITGMSIQGLRILWQLTSRDEVTAKLITEEIKWNLTEKE